MPTNLSNAMEFINQIKSGNPEQFVINMLNERAKTTGDPIMQNLLQSIQNGNSQEVEKIARNIAKERGIDFDKEFNSFKQMFGL